MRVLEREMAGKDWLYMRGKKVSGRIVKVRSGLELVNRMHKAVGGLIRADFTKEDGRLRHVSISGDFFCYPRNTMDRLAAALEGCRAKDVPEAIVGFFQFKEFDVPGVTHDDWISVFKS